MMMTVIISFVMMVMMMLMIMITMTMVDALRKSRGLTQLMVVGILTETENDDGRWN